MIGPKEVVCIAKRERGPLSIGLTSLCNPPIRKSWDKDICPDGGEKHLKITKGSLLHKAVFQLLQIF